MTRVLKVLVVLMASGVPVSAAQARNGVISGQVVDGATGRPVNAALVAISAPAMLGLPPAQQPPRVLTDGDGRFVFRNLEPGSYGVAATKGGYAEAAPGRRRPGATVPAVALSATAMTVEVVVPMWRYSAIAGTVLDEAGEPLVGLQMQVLTRATGRRQFSPAATTYTDDRGAYRFGSLVPGEYLVLAATAPISANASIFDDVARTGRGNGLTTAVAGNRGQTPGAMIGGALLATGRGTATPPPPIANHVSLYPPTFYPSTTAPAQASPIALAIGEERNGVDLQLIPTRTARVSGLLLNAGTPVTMMTVRLIPAAAESIPADIIAPTSITDGSGEFTFAGVVPGRYTLRGSTAAGGGMGWVEMPLTVSGDDVDGLAVMLNPPVRVTGRSRFDGATPPPVNAPRGFTSAPFLLESVDGAMTGLSIAATFGDGGTFALIGYIPGRYRVRVTNSPKGWMFKAAMLDGVDVSETPFDLTKDVGDLVLVYTDRWSGVNGAVDGRGASEGAVLIFPADASSWRDAGPNSRRFRSTRTMARGEFSIGSVPPGDYYIVAVPEDQALDWRDPATLESLARDATQISVAEGETKTLALRLRDIR